MQIKNVLTGLVGLAVLADAASIERRSPFGRALGRRANNQGGNQGNNQGNQGNNQGNQGNNQGNQGGNTGNAGNGGESLTLSISRSNIMSNNG
jgi:transcription initiation factor TFIID subunit 15